MSGSYENRRRRQGIKVFLAGYIGLLLTTVLLQVARSLDLGYGPY